MSTKRWLLTLLEEKLDNARESLKQRKHSDQLWVIRMDDLCHTIERAILLVEQAPEEPRK